MENKKTIIALLVLLATGLAFFSFFSPFVSVGSWHTYSSTGFELMVQDAENGEAGLLLFSFIAALICIISAFSCIYTKNNFSIPMIASIIGAGCVLIYFSEAMDYVTNGFWMFIVLHIISVALCVYAMLSSDSREKKEEVVHQIQHQMTANGNFCPNCGAKTINGKKYCAECGYLLQEKREEKPIQTEPVPEFWICNCCGTRNKYHVQSCQGCGVQKAWSDSQK